MADTESCNCIVCAEEFDPSELKSMALSKLNTTKFKICSSCIEISDPSEDYKQAREIIDSYLNSNHPASLFNDANEIINSIKK